MCLGLFKIKLTQDNPVIELTKVAPDTGPLLDMSTSLTVGLKHKQLAGFRCESETHAHVVKVKDFWRYYEQMSVEERARLFIARIREMNRTFQIPEKLDALRKEDIPRIAKAARAEARFTYAVPRYMRQSSCERVVSQMLV